MAQFPIPGFKSRADIMTVIQRKQGKIGNVNQKTRELARGALRRPFQHTYVKDKVPNLFERSLKEPRIPAAEEAELGENAI